MTKADRGGEPPAPVDAAARIGGLDALRGVALLGILLANVRQMFLPWEIGDFPVALGGSDRLAWIDWRIFHALVDLKFLTLFSLLFGAGFALQGERLAARGHGFAGIYLRRVLILALFGITHALLLYPAEVLTPYAVAGLLLLAVRRWSADSLLRVGLILLGSATLWGYQIGGLGIESLGVPSLAVSALAVILMAAAVLVGWRRSRAVALGAWAAILLGAGCALTVQFQAADGASGVVADYRQAQRQLSAMTAEDEAAWPEEFRVRRLGGIGALVRLHAGQYADILLYFAILLLWRTLALFMVGAGLYRLGAVSGGTPAVWKRAATIGLGIGLPLSALATWLHGREVRGLADWRFPEFLHAFSALPLAAGIAGAVFVLRRRPALRGLWNHFEAAGRMALTNYLGQSLIMAALAEPWGFDLYARLGGPALTILALFVFTSLTLLSRSWLARYWMGPLEWIWRCGTYWRRLPNRVLASP